MGRKTSTPGLYKRSRYWWLTRDPVSGKPMSTRCTDLQAARSFLVERERLSTDPAYAATYSATLGEFASRFVELKKSSGKSAATLQFYLEKLGHAVRVFGSDVPLARFTPSAFDEFVSQRRHEGASDHTISKEVKALIGVLKSAKRVGAYGGEIEILKPEDLTTSYVPRSRAMTQKEVELLVSELAPNIAALVLVSVALGLRLSEACRIEPSDFDFDTGLVRIRGTKTKGSQRTVALLSVFRAWVERALPELPLGGQPYNLHRKLKAACVRAGIDAVSPNDFRRSHATILAELGARAEDMRKLLGHTSTKMIDQVYAKPSAQAVGELIERSICVSKNNYTERLEEVDEPRKSLKYINSLTSDGRASNPVVGGSNPPGRANKFKHLELCATEQSSGLSHQCSKLQIEPILALSYAASLVGVMPANDDGLPVEDVA